MQRTTLKAQKPNLLLAFDAFGTLFHPSRPIAVQYGELGRKHGLSGFTDEELSHSFKQAFKTESKKHPNYGKSAGLNPQTWWSNVIHKTFHPFLLPHQQISPTLTYDLLTHFSSKAAYTIYPDVLPFFHALRHHRKPSPSSVWPWQHTHIAILSNSDDRVASILRSLGLRVSAGPDPHTNPDDPDPDDPDIHTLTLSHAVGAEKPDRRIFDAARREALASALASPHAIEDYELLYVGDEVEKDFLGARAAGWEALVVDRGGVLLRGGEGEREGEGVVRVRVGVDGGDGRRLVGGEEEEQRGGGEVEVEVDVDVIRDLGALWGWRPRGR